MDKWTEKIWRHLEDYKVNVLGIPGKGMNGDKAYGHILPCGTHHRNYMCDAAAKVGDSIKKHAGWHHLNSSQTMCINFFAPMVASDRYAMLNRFLGLFGIETKIKEAVFEYTPVEHSSSFDFFCKDENGIGYYFEIKYTESDIAKESGSSNLEETYQKYYSDSIEKNPLFRNCTEELFMKRHYQAYRNMVKADDFGFCLFITMKGNQGTEQELRSSIDDLKVPENELSRIKCLHWEEIVPHWIEALSEKDSQGHYKFPADLGYYLEFQKKYLLD